MSSSNRIPGPCDAAVYRDHRAIGPLRLPIKNADSFIETFNRLYRSLGIEVEPIVIESPSEEPRDSPPNLDQQ